MSSNVEFGNGNLIITFNL